MVHLGSIRHFWLVLGDPGHEKMPTDSIKECIVQLDDLRFVEYNGRTTWSLERYPVPEPLSSVGPSNSSMTTITARGKRRFTAMSTTSTRRDAHIEIAHDNSESFLNNASLPFSDGVFLVLKIDPPMVTDLIFLGDSRNENQVIDNSSKLWANILNL